jgi:hypothetical protein
VKLSRLNDYDGPFKLQLVLPPNLKGLGADDVAVPAGQNEAKLVLKAPSDAAPGNRQNLVVRADAVLSGDVTLTHEAKINVNVVK